MNTKDISENIIRARYSARLSQVEIAEKMGISRTAYFNFEQGRIHYLSKTLEAFAEALNISVMELLLGYEPDENASRRLSDLEAEYKRKQNTANEVYEKEIESLKGDIAELKAQIHDLREHLADKSSLIALYKGK